MGNDQLLEAISNKLSLLAALNIESQRDKPSRSDQIQMLSKFGLSNNDIAVILGTTKNTVDVLQSRLKKKG